MISWLAFILLQSVVAVVDEETQFRVDMLLSGYGRDQLEQITNEWDGL